MTPDERAGLRQAIANDPGNMSWPSKTVAELLDDLDAAERNLNDWRNAAYAEAQGGKARAEAAEAEIARLAKALADQTWRAGQAESYTAKAFDRLEVHEAARRTAEAERDRARETIAAVRTLAEKWGGEPTTIERFLANCILAIVRPAGSETPSTPTNEGAAR